MTITLIGYRITNDIMFTEIKLGYLKQVVG